MIEIRINNELLCKHDDGMFIVLEINCFNTIKDINDGNTIEIIADDLKIKGELISLEFKDETYVGSVRTQPQRLGFHIRTKYLEDIEFSIRIKLKKI